MDKELKLLDPETGKFYETPSKAKNSIYRCWINMRVRCRSIKHKQYKDYGGRGIKVCDEWNRSFKQFYIDMGDKLSPNLSIDRINNDGNYEPSNCRWADRSTQATNRRRRSVSQPRKLCKVDSCNKVCNSLGLCVAHYRRYQRYGRDISSINNLPIKQKLPRYMGKKCRVMGCDSIAHSKDRCRHHYWVYYRNLQGMPTRDKIYN